MTLRTIIYKNILMRKGKTALVVFGLSLAVAALVSVVTINRSVNAAVDEQLDAYGFNIVITPRTEGFALDYGGVTIGAVNRAPVELNAGDLKAIAALRAKAGRIRNISPKLLEVSKINGRRVVLAGVDLAAERRVKDWWVIEAGRYPENPDELFVGETSAERLGLETGDRVKLFDREFTVSGILMETGGQDDTIIFMDLDKLREASGKSGAVSLIDVAAKTTGDVGPVTAALKTALPKASVRSVRQAVDVKENALGFLLKFGLGVNAIIAGVTALVVFTTTASSVNERQAEIGVFRAIGWRRRSVMAVILGEVFVLGLAGGAIGYLLGFGLASLLSAVAGSDLGMSLLASSMGGNMTADNPASSVGAVALDPGLFLIALALACGIGLAAGLIPARRAADLSPAEALKTL